MYPSAQEVIGFGKKSNEGLASQWADKNHRCRNFLLSLKKEALLSAEKLLLPDVSTGKCHPLDTFFCHSLDTRPASFPKKEIVNKTWLC